MLVLSAAVLVLVIDRLSRLAVWRFPPRLSDPSFDSVRELSIVECYNRELQRPTNCYLSDWYVFPENFAWTMAFTHEDGWLGPYFARHERFSELNRENEMKMRKAREAEAARLKGWR